MIKQIIAIFLLIPFTFIYATDSLEVYGKIIDQSGNAIENAKISAEAGNYTYTDENGNYLINISKDYVPIDYHNIILNNCVNYCIKIYNLLGQKILDKEYYQSDFTKYSWDGTNKLGKLVSSGMYFGVLEIEDNVIYRNKIVIIGHEVLNKRPFINVSIQQINTSSLLKSVDYNYDTNLTIEGESFVNIYSKKIKIDFNGNNDNCAIAENIVVDLYDYIYDIDGNSYKIVKIGNQWWMAENLKVTHYNNGDTIPNNTIRKTIWQNYSDSKTGAYSILNHDKNNVETYGYLYNWYAINDKRRITPEGWHIPTDKEWEELAKYISSDNGGFKKTLSFWYEVGEYLQSRYGWSNLVKNGIDKYGFEALPGGFRSNSGYYNTGGEGFYANFHSSTTSSYDSTYEYSNYALSRYIHGSLFWNVEAHKGNGYSVRCVRD